MLKAQKKSSFMCCGKLARLKTRYLSRWNALSLPILKIRQTCSKWFNCSSKAKTTAGDECQLNRILIFNQFVNCDEISKAWNDAGVAVSQYTTLWRLHQLGYDSRISILKPLHRSESIQYGLKIIKIGLLINGTRSSSVKKQDSVFPSVIMAPTSGESHVRGMMHEKSIKSLNL